MLFYSIRPMQHMKVILLVTLLFAFLTPAFGDPRIIHIEEGDLYIDIGIREGVKVEDEFEVYREREEALLHPISGERLGHPFKRIGRIRVKWVGERFSIADPIFLREDEEMRVMDILIPCLEKPPIRPRYGGILKGAFIHGPLSLDPLKIRSQREALLVSCLYDTLVVQGEDGRLLPSLAKRWEMERGGLTLYIYLEEGVRFHDDRPLCAEDVKYSLERLLQSPLGHRFDKIERIEIIDDTTLMIELTSKDPILMERLTQPQTSILPRGAEGDFFNNPIGTGPFRLSKWEEGREILLHSNDLYFKARPYVDGVVFGIFEDEETALLEFETGGVDFLKVPHQELRRFLQNVRWRECIFQNEEEIHLILVREGLGANLSKAIDLAIDRETIIDVLLNGAGSIEPSSPPYKPDRAKRLLQEESLSGLTLMIVGGFKTPLRIAKKIEDDLSKVGLSINIQRVGWRALVERIDSKRYDLVYLVLEDPSLYELYMRERPIRLFSLPTHTIYQPHLHNLKSDWDLRRVWLIR